MRGKLTSISFEKMLFCIEDLLLLAPYDSNLCYNTLTFLVL